MRSPPDAPCGFEESTSPRRGALRARLAGAVLLALFAEAVANAQPAPPPAPAAAAMSIDAALADKAATEAAIQQVPEADKLRSPDAPAFAILGASPTEIQKPTTPRDLAVSLSAFLDEQGGLQLPDNLALQVAPYWVAQGKVPSSDYAATGASQLWKNFSLSLATASADGAPARELGAGVSTHYAFDEAQVRCETYDAALVRLAEETSLALTDEEMQALSAEHPDDASLASILQVRKARRAAGLDKALDQARLACAKASAARTRVLSASAALRWRFPGAAAEDGDLISQAYWLTYAHTANPLTALVLGRVRLDEAQMGWDGFLDAGARAVIARDAYAASLEVVARRQFAGAGADGADTLLRVSLLVEYLVKDDSWLTVTFGKEFAAADAGSLFSLVNLTTTFGEHRVERLVSQ